MEIFTTLLDNWEVVSAGALALIAGADKVFLILIATMGNVRDSWQKTFPKRKGPYDTYNE